VRGGREGGAEPEGADFPGSLEHLKEKVLI